MMTTIVMIISLLISAFVKNTGNNILQSLKPAVLSQNNITCLTRTLLKVKNVYYKSIFIRGGSSNNATSAETELLSFITNEQRDKEATLRKLNEQTVFSGYRTVVRKQVALPTGKIASFDVIVQRHLSVFVFVWDSISRTATLVI